MKNLVEAFKGLKAITRGAACFFDPALQSFHCINGLTKDEAEQLAAAQDVELKGWQAGEVCSRIKCT
ncbi:hypothetical protein SAMN04515674_102263 [Pseudarcicella hirudinis]|uniref:Uncharacterized protein n=1 Tax=Pseudarcicella hirudinis TaxID=1079859 RepID=A0A1I5P3Q0_9BACT|nr:hypothetical protein [Pseudarcicella hirudinis]SFP28724.1 hypothetical protein SAMN04515674_102263 [Pseudarcicella hirudinis]